MTVPLVSKERKLHLKLRTFCTNVPSLLSIYQEETGCCPNKNPFSLGLKRFLLINLGEVEDQRFKLFEPEGRV